MQYSAISRRLYTLHNYKKYSILHIAHSYVVLNRVMQYTILCTTQLYYAVELDNSASGGSGSKFSGFGYAWVEDFGFQSGSGF